jgi:DNA-binding NtrC family response regulator
VRRTLTTYHWPGNVRELENIIERAVILDTDNVISRDDLPDVILNGTDLFTAKDGQALKNASACLKDALKEPERIYILKVLQEVGWNKKRAANKLGLNRTTLYNKLKRYNLLSQNDKLSS